MTITVFSLDFLKVVRLVFYLIIIWRKLIYNFELAIKCEDVYYMKH